MSEKIILFIIFIAGIVVVTLIKSKKSKEVADTGIQKQQIRNMVDTVIENGTEYSVVYGDYESRRGRRVYYYYYCIAFKEDEIQVIPIQYDDGQVTSSTPIVLNKNNVGRIDIKFKGSNAIFYDLEDKKIIDIFVSERVFSTDALQCPFDIYQETEANEFYLFIKKFKENLNNKL